jgi:hypothetical protein
MAFFLLYQIVLILLKTTTMTSAQTIIQKSLLNTFSYKEYRNHVTQLLEEGLSTGATQSEDLTHYSTLNEVRMNRLDKTIVIPDEIKVKLQSLVKDYILLVLSEGWCGDAAQIVPVINKMNEVTNKLDLRIVLRDDNPELMDMYLTNGGRSIPKLILIDKETLEPKGSWGPRPKDAAQLIADFKQRDGIITDEAKTELQKWYLHDKGHSTMQEIFELVEGV